MSSLEDAFFPFEQLDVYSLALDFATDVYLLTADFPVEESLGLTAQMRKAASCVSLKIADGRGRGNDREFVDMLKVARGALFEVVSASQIAHRLGYLDQVNLTALRFQAKTLSTKLLVLINRMPT